MLSTALLLGLAQLTFVPPEAPKPQPAPAGAVCRRLTLPQWDKPRTVCLTPAQWRELGDSPYRVRQRARAAKK